MQKLVWQNSIGDSVDLTSGNYGITEWEGFANTSLNIQSQQVPFQDGGIFLDALMEQRELSVTLKMQDNGNLENRYRMRRELIHILNPKLGEGYLIYTNDFTSKRIKCVPQIPLFKTHNSNDSGTPEASLAWTACEPYWEDLEETEKVITKIDQPIVTNNGEIDIGITIDVIPQSAKNIEIFNKTTGKKIKILGTINNPVSINTNVGQKSVKENNFSSDVLNYSIGTYITTYLKEDDVIYFGTINGYVGITNDKFKTIKLIYKVSNIPITTITKAFGKYYIGAMSEPSQSTKYAYIYTTTDFENFTQTSSVFGKVYYFERFNTLVELGLAGRISISDDGENFTLVVNRHGNIPYYDAIDTGTQLLFCGPNICKTEDLEDFTFFSVGTGAFFTSLTMFKDKIIIGTYNSTMYRMSIEATDVSEVPSVTGLYGYADPRGYFYNENGYYTIDGLNYNKNSQISFNCCYYDEIEHYTYLLSNAVKILYDLQSVQNAYNNYVNYNTGKFSSAITKNGYYYCYNGKLEFSKDGSDFSVQETLSNSSYKVISSYEEMILYDTIQSSNHYIKYSSNGGSSFTQIEYSALENEPIKNAKYIKETNTFMLWSINNLYFVKNGVIEHTIPLTLREDSCAFYFDGYYYLTKVTDNIIYKIKALDFSQTTITSDRQTRFSDITFDKINGVFVGGYDNSIMTSTDLLHWYIVKSFGLFQVEAVNYFEKYAMTFVILENGNVYICHNDNNTSLSYTEDGTFLFYPEYTRDFVVFNKNNLVKIGIIKEDGFNIINNLSSDSDLTFGLIKGQNRILINAEEGIINCIFKYRQKYIGV